MLNDLSSYIARTLTLKADDLVMDIGCGEAELTNAIAKHAGLVYGIEPDEKALIQARLDEDNVSLNIGAAADLASILPSQVSHALAYNIWQYMNSDQKALEALECIYRSLAPGGKFFIGAVIMDDHFDAFLNTWQSQLNVDELASGVGRGWKAEQISYLANKAGFVSLPLPLKPVHLNLPFRFDYLLKKPEATF